MIILGTNSIKDTGFDVANSCRFNAPDDAYMHKTPSSSGSRRIGTFSIWVKLALNTPEGQFLFSGSPNATTETSLLLSIDGDNLRFNGWTSNVQHMLLVTNRKFIDPSAYYNIVVAWDTTQGTASNRVKIYINGVQETSFSTETYPDQNRDLNINNSGNKTLIGARSTANYAFADGYYSEVVMIDGTALTPTSFGEFDEDSGIWKPIDVSGLTFGTNGFYLDFEDSSNLGNDANGGTDFTEVNLAATDQSTDTCTNNFATMNPLDNFYQGATFSDGNLTVTTTNSSQSYSTSSIMVSSGKWYVECKPVSGGSEPEIGVAYKMVGVGNGNNAQLSYNANGYGYRASNPGSVWYNGSAVSTGFSQYANGDIIGIALDLDNNKLYFSKNGTFGNSGDPTSGATGTGAISIVDPASTDMGAYAFAMNETFNDQNKVFSWNFGSPPFSISSGNSDGNGYGNFEYAVPSGYYALNTKNLAEYG